MKKPLLLTIVILALATLAITLTAGEEVDVTTQLKKIEIPTSMSKAVLVKLESEIGATVHIYQSEFFEETSVVANVHILNKTGKTRYLAYYIAFFNKDKDLVGCAGTHTDVEPAEEDYATQHSNMLILPKEQLDTIKYYQIRYYEQDGKMN